MVTSTHSANTNIDTGAYHLDWHDRPSDLKILIDSAFASICKNTSSQWGLYNGTARYNLCGINDYKLMENIIRKSPASQNDFYALDIGCGNFQWGEGLASFVDNSQTYQDLSKYTSSM